MKALYFRYHSLIREDCHDLAEGKAIVANIDDAGDGMGIGVYDDETKTLYMAGFDDIIGADPKRVESRVLRDLKTAGIEPAKIESLNQ